MPVTQKRVPTGLVAQLVRHEPRYAVGVLLLGTYQIAQYWFDTRLRVAIKADKDSQYGMMEDVMAVMQKTNTITFSLVTELVASKKSAMRG